MKPAAARASAAIFGRSGISIGIGILNRGYPRYRLRSQRSERRLDPGRRFDSGPPAARLAAEESAAPATPVVRESILSVARFEESPVSHDKWILAIDDQRILHPDRAADGP